MGCRRYGGRAGGVGGRSRAVVDSSSAPSRSRWLGTCCTASAVGDGNPAAPTRSAQHGPGALGCLFRHAQRRTPSPTICFRGRLAVAPGHRGAHPRPRARLPRGKASQSLSAWSSLTALRPVRLALPLVPNKIRKSRWSVMAAWLVWFPLLTGATGPLVAAWAATYHPGLTHRADLRYAPRLRSARYWEVVAAALVARLRCWHVDHHPRQPRSFRGRRILCRAGAVADPEPTLLQQTGPRWPCPED